jgi:protein-S-isoprenylcysteine O-methyltransferase Ste14
MAIYNHAMHSAGKITAYLLLAGAILLGGISLVLFGAFVYAGSIELVPLGLATGTALALDAALCLVFFAQHSGMVRRPFQQRVLAALPAPYRPAVYAIASGVALFVFLAFWQRSDIVLYSAQGPVRWLLRGVFAAAVIGLAWALVTLKHLDALGVHALLRHLRGRETRALPLAIRGPYRWVRHPLYFLVLVLIWTCPDVTLDRLLFAVLWSAWIVAGTLLEERDLAAEFGDSYRAYQRAVPMLIPWHAPRWPDTNGDA